ncbi:hypothetical protein B0E45_10895 [Sinorhizobium sp. A49]|uniref:hypothetical protein n=1 Tax=Sinorhizobium sp. A49 TaxID=1945861 RepID=UPI0009869DEE|nr:hypothetical protein [Sinorhizobium sp. A49]OOG71546.1 hypothetical protein B0E45_10895 [Sinorhizobium sp. A49]
MNAAAGTLYKIRIERTLYQFDEPILFTARVGMLNALFVRTDYTEDGHEFLSCYIDDKHLDGLLEGRLSVRGAFEAQSDNFLVYANDAYEVSKELTVTGDELKGRLPDPNVGVFEHLGECPDVLQEKNAFLAVYFRGENLRRDAIPYSTLMKLLGTVQVFARNVLVPPSLRGHKASTLDFLVGDPALGSLMIAIKEPTFNLSRLRHAQNDKNLTREGLKDGASNHKDEFFAEVQELVESPQNFRAAHIDDEEDVFESIKHLLPSDDTPYSNLTFSTQDGNSLKRISIDRDRADRVRASYSNANSVRSRRSGTIVEINASSATLLLRSPGGAITTSSFTREAFDAMRRNIDFKIGARLIVDGDLIERPRRDYLTVQNVASLNDRPLV